MISKKDKKFVDKINDTIRDETYDDLDESEWEIIEELLTIIDTISKPSVVSELDIIKALDKVDYHSDDGSIGINQDKEKLCLGEILSGINIEKIAKCVHNLITKGL